MTRLRVPPQFGVTHSQVSAGGGHTVLLRSDGLAVTCGDNRAGQCLIPRLEDGVTYKVGKRVIHVWSRKRPAFMLRFLPPGSPLAAFIQGPCPDEAFRMIAMFL